MKNKKLKRLTKIRKTLWKLVKLTDSDLADDIWAKYNNARIDEPEELEKVRRSDAMKTNQSETITLLKQTIVQCDKTITTLQDV